MLSNLPIVSVMVNIGVEIIRHIISENPLDLVLCKISLLADRMNRLRISKLRRRRRKKKNEEERRI